MEHQGDALERMAAALERLSPSPKSAAADWLAYPAYVWLGNDIRPVARIEAPSLNLLRGIDAQKQAVTASVLHHARGHAAHDMLLWGARGMGKSALLRASVSHAQVEEPGSLALIQVGTEALGALTELFTRLSAVDRRFLVFIDDLGFAEGDAIGPRQLRSWLDGGVEARPGNVRLAVTSNRRAIVPREMSEQDDPLNPRDVVDDRLALADRFGLTLGFHACSQDDYLAIVGGYAESYGLVWLESDALEWSRRRGARSGRTAWHYITELAARAGRPIDP
jgi:predicted AAA+ superfamily ATPase